MYCNFFFLLPWTMMVSPPCNAKFSSGSAFPSSIRLTFTFRVMRPIPALLSQHSYIGLAAVVCYSTGSRDCVEHRHRLRHHQHSRTSDVSKHADLCAARGQQRKADLWIDDVLTQFDGQFFGETPEPSSRRRPYRPRSG